MPDVRELDATGLLRPVISMGAITWRCLVSLASRSIERDYDVCSHGATLGSDGIFFAKLVRLVGSAAVKLLRMPGSRSARRSATVFLPIPKGPLNATSCNPNCLPLVVHLFCWTSKLAPAINRSDIVILALLSFIVGTPLSASPFSFSPKYLTRSVSTSPSASTATSASSTTAPTCRSSKATCYRSPTRSCRL